MSAADVLVVGGGVAGISAAVHLADAGRRVTLLEQRKLLGGRAGSFQHDLGAGGLLDNSPHVLLGCCTELQRLYARLGVSDLIRFEDAIEFADNAGRRARMKASILPSPLHLGPSLATFRLLSIRQKAQIARAMMSMYFSGRDGRERRADLSFRDYLFSLGQSGETIEAYWDVICISALNETCADASAKYGMQVFQESFLGGRGGYRLGYSVSPLSKLYESIAHVQIRSAASVRSLNLDGDRVTGVTLVGGEAISAAHVVLATNPANALPLLRPLNRLDPQLARIEQIQFRSILGAHLLYDRPVPLKTPVSLIGTRLQWLFPDPSRPELLHGVVSAADLLTDSHSELPAIFDHEAKSAIPELAECRLVNHLIVKESRATFRPVPGIDQVRPSQKTGVPGLTLAGDYTLTDWPATMEGAARSGRLAAAVVCASVS